MLVVVVLLLLVGAGVFFVGRRRRALAQSSQDSLHSAARLLGAQVRRDVTGERLFVDLRVGPLDLRLRRELRGGVEGEAELTVLELLAPAYEGPTFEIHEQRSAARTTLRPPLTDIIKLDDIEPPVVTLYAPEHRQQVERRLQGDDTRRLIGYALNRKQACLHLSPTGSWFECAGFSSDAELLVATLRTAARALQALVGTA